MFVFSKSNVFVLLAGILLLVSCRKGETENSASLDSVSVLSSDVRITKGGTSTVRFITDPPELQFNYHVGASGCCISLGGSPEGFYLAEVSRVGTGIYEATLRDSGGDEAYIDKACIVYSDAGGSVSSNTFTVTRVYTEELADYELTGLPVVYLDTRTPVKSKDIWTEGSVRIDGRESSASMEQVSCSVKGRGNTTWTWPKKPYTVRLEKKREVLGMPEHKRWVLLANFMDRTLMRNIVSMHVGSLLGNLAWTPRCRSVELVMNGKHQGTYLLIEQVRVDGDRVDIGGKDAFMLESDFHYNNKVQWIDHHGSCNNWSYGIPFSVRHPDPDSVSTDQVERIKKYISTVAGALYSDGFEEKYPAYLDVDSFIDYWIAFEVMGNHELQNPGSVFMHKDDGGLLTAGPLWDFDWGVLSYRTSPGAQKGLINDHAIWYDRLFDDPAFRKALKARWEQVLPELRGVPSFIDSQKAALEASAKLNFAMWNPADDASQNGGRIINGDENMSFDAAVERLRSIYIERLDVISASLAAM